MPEKKSPAAPLQIVSIFNDYKVYYVTQGTSLADLKEHLLDLYQDLSSGAIPAVRQHAELQVK